MKYVIFKFRSLYIPMLMPECATHSQAKLEGAVAVSAGFWRQGEDGLAEVFGESESLKLRCNKERDSMLINHLMSNSGTAHFLCDDYDW